MRLLHMMMHHHSPHSDHKPQQVRRLSKLLLRVTVQGSIGAVQVIMSPENTVGDLIKAVLDVYEKEKRRPVLNERHPSCFELHYSPFSFQSLKVEEKLINVGSRNFFMCQSSISNAKFYARTCLDKPKEIDKLPHPLLKLMDILL